MEAEAARLVAVADGAVAVADEPIPTETAFWAELCRRPLAPAPSAGSRQTKPDGGRASAPSGHSAAVLGGNPRRSRERTN